MNPKVFISYCLDNNIDELVLKMAQRLREDGIDCQCDKYKERSDPSISWQDWMNNMVLNSDYIILICTKNYYAQISNKRISKKKGVKFEYTLMLNEFYNNGSINEIVLPVIFKSTDIKYIPEAFQPSTRYLINNDTGYYDLYRRITNQPSIEIPPLGSIINLKNKKNIPKKNDDEKTLDETVDLIITINKDFCDFSTEDQKNILDGFKSFLMTDKDIYIKRRSKGSTKLTLEISSKDAEKLFSAIKSGALKEYNIIDVQKKKIDDKEEFKIYEASEVLHESIKYFNGDELAANVWMIKYALKEVNNKYYFEKTPQDMHWRIACEIARIENKYANPLSATQIFELLKDFKYLIPHGGSMLGIGNIYHKGLLSNSCVIGNVGNIDTYGSILKLDNEQVQLMKHRIGVGHDLSGIQPEGSDVINNFVNTPSFSSIVERYSNSANEVGYDGRKGDLMLTVSIKHPESEKLIDAKTSEGKKVNANISIRIDDHFMNAVINDQPYTLIYPVDSENPIYKKEINPKQLWDKIVFNAWKSSEPGILFWDTIIRESIPDCYVENGFKTTSVNPSGEMPLSPYENNIKLSINLYSYVISPFTNDSFFNEELFIKHVWYAQRIIDDIVDLEIEKIEKILVEIDNSNEDEEVKIIEKKLWHKIKIKCNDSRRVGIGVTAEADMLAALNLRYGSPAATQFSIEIHKKIAIEAFKASVSLARERGAFPLYNSQKEKSNSFILRLKKTDPKLYKDMLKYGRRNMALLSISPTGTISLMTQTTSGIEPCFLVFYKRRRKVNPNDINSKVSFVDEVGDCWAEYYVFHNKFIEWLKANSYKVEEIVKLSEYEINDLIKKSPYYNATTNDIDWHEKIKLQGAIQKWVDHSISMTINLPENVSVYNISEVYKTAWECGCKNVFVYREGSRSGILLSSKIDKENTTKDLFTHNPSLKRPNILPAKVYRFQIGSEKWIAFIGILDNMPFEIFTGALNDTFLLPRTFQKCWILKTNDNNNKIRYDFQYLDNNDNLITFEGLSKSFNSEYWNYTKIVTSLMRNRMPLTSIIEIVDSFNIESNSINSWKNGVITALKGFIPDGTKSENKLCESCGNDSLVYQEGCLVCTICGSSKCG